MEWLLSTLSILLATMATIVIFCIRTSNNSPLDQSINLVAKWNSSAKSDSDSIISVTTTTTATTAALVSIAIIPEKVARDYYRVTFQITNVKWIADYDTIGSLSYSSLLLRVSNFVWK